MKKSILTLASALLLVVQVNAAESSTTSSTKPYAYSDAEVQDQEDDPMKTKTFSKSFTLDKNDKIELANQYGATTIKTWDKNEIKVDVDIKAYAKSEAEAQELLDNVSINATKNGDLVSYKTNIGERNGRWGRSIKNGKTVWRREVKVYYTVFMPASNSLTTSQQYGNITMGDFAGPTSIKVQYGNLIAGNLTNGNNYISIQYGKGEVKDMGGAQIKHQYGGGITLGTVNNLNLDAQYTSVKVVAVKGAASIKHQYGAGTTIGSVSGALNVNTQYCTIKIDNLRGNLTSRTQYGKMVIGNIEAGRDVDVDAQYAAVNLGFATNYHGDLDVKTSYAGFKYGANVTAKTSGDNERGYSQHKNYTGQIGKGGNAKVIIKAQYNSVTFN
ncbi:hypothetical protein [Pedobacter insulae]|uniref:Adhesin n=1 Tax=Pedobacter insulae TaxID=414048 RepID=A0A1I2X6Y5_9SPHI|nr:hypothetical protein [Pedobacter insulae]SFH09142.1 hypothetical protein SAMN04489864_10528 [Pedobacter insulae]